MMGSLGSRLGFPFAVPFLVLHLSLITCSSTFPVDHFDLPATPSIHGADRPETAINGLDPSLRKALKLQFEQYDLNHNHQLDVDEYLSLIGSIKGLRGLHIKRNPCGTHLLSTCKTIEKLYNRQTKAVMLHKMCKPCAEQLKPFPNITGMVHLPKDWKRKKMNKLVDRDLVKRTGKSRTTGRWLSGKEYLKSLTFGRARL
jgi:hypothetical protein